MKKYIIVILLLVACAREESLDSYQGEWCYEYYTPEGDLWGFFSVILKQEGDSLKGSHYISIMEGEINDIGMGHTIKGAVDGDMARITLKSWLADNPAEATFELINSDSLLFILTKEPSNNSDRDFENIIIPYEVLFTREKHWITSDMQEGVEALVSYGITWNAWQNSAKEIVGVDPTQENLINLSKDDAKKIQIEFWNSYRIDEINDISTKHLIYDYLVCSPSGALKSINRVLNEEFGESIPFADSMTSETIYAINHLDPKEFCGKLTNAREAHYLTRAELPGHDRFTPAWSARINRFRD